MCYILLKINSYFYSVDGLNKSPEILIIINWLEKEARKLKLGPVDSDGILKVKFFLPTHEAQIQLLLFYSFTFTFIL